MNATESADTKGKHAVFHKTPSQDDEIQTAADDLGFRVVRYGAWSTLDAAGWQRVGNTLAEVKTDNGCGLQIMQIGTWTHVDGNTGCMTTGDDWNLALAIGKALHASP